MKHIFLLFFVSIPFFGISQKLQFNQTHLSGLYTNPALTGINPERKITATFRNEWPNLSGGSLSSLISFESGRNRFGGWGAYYLNDLIGQGTINSNRLGLNYAKHMQVSRKLTISVGANATLAYDHVDWAKVTFGDVFHPRTGQFFDMLNPKEHHWSSDFSAGAFFYTEHFYGGFSTQQFARLGGSPLLSLFSNIGYTFSFEKAPLLTISPEISHYYVDGFHQLSAKISSFYSWARLGFEYDLRNGYSVVAGARIKQFEISFSTEWTTSKLTNSSGFSYELGLAFRFRDRVCKHLRHTFYQRSLF